MRKTILALAPAMLLMSTAAQAAPPPWKVSEVSGKVQLGENGRSRAAVRGALLASGATITTAPGARAVIVRGEEFVVISPNTRLRVPEAAEAGGIMQMIEEFGTALFKIKKKSTPHFGVKTPYLAAVVKGTTFTVTVGPEGGTVQVTEGAVEVSTLDGGAADLVTPGAIAMVGASDLYRLSIEGESAKVLRSNDAPPAGAVTTSAVPAAVPAYAGPATSSVDITAPVSEAAKPLGEVTGGLVGGSAGVELAAAEAADQSRGARRFERGKDDNVPGGGNDNKPDKDKPDGSKPDKDKPEKPDKDKPEKPDEPKPDKPDEPKPDKDKPEEPKPDAPKPEEPKAGDPVDGGADDDGKGDKGDKGDDGKADKPDKGAGDELAAPESAPDEVVPADGSSGSGGDSSGTGSGDAGEGASSDAGSGGGEGDSGSSGSDGNSDEGTSGDASGGSDSGSSGGGSDSDSDSGSSGGDSGSSEGDSGSSGSDSGSSDEGDSGSSDDADSDDSGSGSSGGGDSSGGDSGGFAGGVALPGTDPGDAFDDDLGGDDDDDDDSDDDGGLCLLGLVCLGGDDDDGPGSSN